ncbi:unnamed protein product [Soboliphyme baturini]|uniref:Neprilysin n=1 Tax=Soboliphyme baturini TaxID=241478 RepID=A0A183IFM8_9BILA|nr:unnamed protein product [Soboliphyme baturini]
MVVACALLIPTKQKTYTRNLKDIANSIDHSVSPCNDFYRYACGNWIKKMSEKYRHASTFGLLSSEVTTQIAKTINKMEKEPAQPFEKTVAAFFRACKQSHTTNHEVRCIAIQRLKSMGGWPIITRHWNALAPGFTVSQTIGYIISNFGAPTFVNPYVSVNWNNVDENAIFFGMPVLTGKASFYLSEKNLNSLKAVIVATANYLKENDFIHLNLEAEAESIVLLEKDLAEMILRHSVADDNYKAKDNRVSYITLTRRWPTIKWQELFTGLGLKPFEKQLENTTFIVTSPAAMDYVIDVIADAEHRTLVNYLLWSSLRHLLPFILADITKNYNLYLSNSDSECVDILVQAMPFAIGRVYTGQDYSSEKRMKIKYDNDFRQLVEFTADAFGSRLKALKWMDDNSKSKALQKVKDFVENIAYPDWTMIDSSINAYYESLTNEISTSDPFVSLTTKLTAFDEAVNFQQLLKKPDRKDFLGSPADVNAWYIAQYNSITIPAAIANPSFYSTEYPMAVNFGALGAVIGHEMTHGFDNSGVQFDAIGKLQMWMSAASEKGFQKMAECVVNQYSNVCYKKVNKCINGNQTEGENIADNGGIKAAFYGYQNYVKSYGQEAPVNNLKDYTMNQIFFLAFAHSWCEITTPEQLLKQLDGDVHSPADARVIETLKNFPEFSAAFNCPKGTEMNPEIHCDVW